MKRPMVVQATSMYMTVQTRLVQITGPEGEILHQYTYGLAGNLIKAVHGKNYRKAEETSTGDRTGNKTGDRTEQEETIGELYSYNSLGWLMESRTPWKKGTELSGTSSSGMNTTYQGTGSGSSATAITRPERAVRERSIPSPMNTTGRTA